MSENLHYSEVTARLDEIVSQVKRKDLSLAQSLDLLNEAISLGNKAIDLVDIPHPEPEADEIVISKDVSPALGDKTADDEIALSEDTSSTKAVTPAFDSVESEE